MLSPRTFPDVHPTGSLVTLSIKARVAAHENGAVRLSTESGTIVAIRHPTRPDPDIEVEPIGPAGWPPQAGDVWLEEDDGGAVWFVYSTQGPTVPARDAVLCGRSDGGLFLDCNELLPGLRQRHPRLILRDGVPC